MARAAVACGAGVLSLAAAWPVQAQMFRDPVLQRLADGERMAEMQQLSLSRLAAHADVVQAVLGLGLAVLAGNDAQAQEKAIAHAQACVKAQPRPRSAAMRWAP